ncbi:hypothetical protein BY996DRAFT_6416103 [Phakopsora pachyrhizi]|uniref:Secreted protein n=1 Tax=Phakopsora pachyrhizi TaxID=170000 RepID=A0A0S1MJH0_PHAPC|nr:hypothetical protein BY996DRAFT_6416103 [Phakopsora pachyrhizi]
MNRFMILAFVLVELLLLTSKAQALSSNCEEAYFESNVPKVAGVPQAGCKSSSSKEGFLCSQNSCSGLKSCTQCKRYMPSPTAGKSGTFVGNIIPMSINCKTDYVLVNKIQMCSNANNEKYGCVGACTGMKSCSSCVKASDPSLKAGIGH